LMILFQAWVLYIILGDNDEWSNATLQGI
jgi:hypothetical protein